MNYKDMKIFDGLSQEEIEEILSKTTIITKSFAKGEYVFRTGDKSSDFYYLIEGQIHVFQIDSSGKRFIFQNLDKPTGFGEVYAYLNEPFDFDGVCEKESKVLIIKDFKKLFAPPVSVKFLENYISFISQKCLQLSKKNQITSKSSLRGKIAKFLIENEGNLKGSMSREDMADYLTTTRPSLSRELSKMADDGLVEIDGRDIKIVDFEGIEELI